MEFANISAGDIIKVVSGDEFKVIDGNPIFNKNIIVVR